MLATAGDTHLGGEDLDARLIEHLLSTWEKKHPGQPSLRDDKRAMQMVRREAERAKRVLSTAPSARVEIDGLGGGVEFSETVTRAKFEELCADLFKQTLVSCPMLGTQSPARAARPWRTCLIWQVPVERVLEDAEISKSEVDEVVLVGGSTRIPKVPPDQCYSRTEWAAKTCFSFRT